MKRSIFAILFLLIGCQHRATVAKRPLGITPAPTGTVTFFDGPTPIGTSTLIGGTATFADSSLSVGSHTITAQYSGDANYNPSVSMSLVQIVNPALTPTTTTITSTPNPSTAGQNVTVTGQVNHP